MKLWKCSLGKVIVLLLLVSTSTCGHMKSDDVLSPIGWHRLSPREVARYLRTKEAFPMILHRFPCLAECRDPKSGSRIIIPCLEASDVPTL